MSTERRTIFVLAPTYRVLRGVTVAHLYGVTERGESVLVVDDRVRPYFFVPDTDREAARVAARPLSARREEDLVDWRGRPVARLAFREPREVPPARDALAAAGIPCFEADVRYAYRVMIDAGIRGSVEVEGEAGAGRWTDLVFRRPRYRPARFAPRLRVLSLDIETDRRAAMVYSIALSGDGAETVLLWHHRDVPGAEVFPDERSMLEALVSRITAADPDVLTGWNFVDFDLSVLARRADELGVPLRVGRGEGRILFREDAAYTRRKRASVPGRQVLDAIGLVRDAGLPVEDYRLETVARAVLGRGKLATGRGRVAEIERAFREDPEWLVRYNLEDARLVTEILDRTGALSLAVERSLLTGMPLDRVGASVASFDFLYLGELRRRGRVAPAGVERAGAGHVVGGTVLDSRPGIFPFVVVVDFRSLYPSVVRTFGIDPLAFRGMVGDEGEGLLRAPNGALFKRGEGILPGLVAGLMTHRDRAKAEGDRARATAIKLLMNSFYGVLGTATCRFADSRIANAITSFGAEVLSRAKRRIEEMGFEVIYGDTDSLFVLSGAGDGEAAREAGRRIRERVDETLARWAREEYGVESCLVLELERVYRRFFLPHVRGGGEGSKKRYAGLVEEGEGTRLEVVGLEAVRRDWPEAGRRFQRELLRRVLSDEDAREYVRDTVRRLRTGALDRDLVYRKVLRKNPDEYVRAQPPHVRAAVLAGTKRGGVVHYVITRSGPQPVTPDGPLPPGVDYDHYVGRVLEPIADAILTFLDLRFADISGDDPQLRLFE